MLSKDIKIILTSFIITIFYIITSNNSCLASGRVDVNGGVTVSPSTVTIDEDFNIWFSLKEYQGENKTLEYVELWMQDENGNDLWRVHRWDAADRVSFSPYEQKNYSITTSLSSSYGRQPGTYRAIVRGNFTAGTDPFNFGVVSGSGASNPRIFTAVAQASGRVDVNGGVTVSPSTVIIDEDFNISFSLKEYQGENKTLEYVELWMQDGNGNDLWRVHRWDTANRVSFSPYEQKNYSVTTSLSSSYGRQPGTYRAIVRGNFTAGTDPFNFGVVSGSGASNPRIFSAVAQASGRVDVYDGVTVSPSTLIIDKNFSISFSLKEYQGASKTLEYVELWMQDGSGQDLWRIERWDNVSFTPNEQKYYSITTSLLSSYGRQPGTYRAIVRGNFTPGTEPFNFGVVPGSGAVNPVIFMVASDTYKIFQSDNEGDAGTIFTQSGTGFTPNSTVTLYVTDPNGTTHAVSDHPATDNTGSFSTDYSPATDKPIGKYTWWVVDDTTGLTSTKLCYNITKNNNVLSSIDSGAITAPLPPWGNIGTGILTSEGDFDPAEDTFVIVHGWNNEKENGVYKTELPDWVTDMGKKLKENSSSPAKGSNVLYYNWQRNARTDYEIFVWDDNGLKDSSCTDLYAIGVPFDRTKNAGESLAHGLAKRLDPTYNHTIHLIGHSLGTLVITYAAKDATKNGFAYASQIKHIVYLDSPCYFGKPGTDFIKNHSSSIFFENYMSIFGRPYKDADVNIYLSQASLGGASKAHGYAHKWYEGSITNNLPFGFYWWDESHRHGLKKNYKQKNFKPSGQLFPGKGKLVYGMNGDIGILIDGKNLTDKLLDKMSTPLAEWLEEYAIWSGNKVVILGANTMDTLEDIQGYLTDIPWHAAYNDLGFIELTHSSTAVLTMPVHVPTQANALSFSFNFLYGSSGSKLEVFINDKKAVFTTTGQVALQEPIQLIPWIDVSKYAGQNVNLNIRISHPENGAEGKVRIDDLIFANISPAIHSFPWGMFRAAISSNKNSSTPATCDAIHLSLCSSPSPCTTAGGYWYNNSCNRKPETPPVATVTSAGQVWMDRNLGASRVATSSTDAQAYGDLYQWGRGTDGHEKRTSSITSTNSNSDAPGHGQFITVAESPSDWRTPQNNHLWQGVNGINNPCPSGFRLPTKSEWDHEISSWVSNDAAGGFSSPLKLVVGGYRHHVDGNIGLAGNNGRYWTSTVYSASSYILELGIDNAYTRTYVHAGGNTVRCIKE